MPILERGSGRTLFFTADRRCQATDCCYIVTEF